MDESVPDLVFAQNHPNDSTKKVPITIITGFLGSGKTTLLQAILKSDHGLKIAVLMNEFAESGEIERQITTQKAGKLADEWIEFDNGCLCCAVKDAAFLALESLLKKRRDIDHIIIETSGMANPGPIVQKLWVDDALECNAVLDGVVCLIDAVHGYSRLNPASSQYAKEAAIQVALSDLVMVNKCDLAGERQLSEIQDLVREINPLVNTKFTSYSETSLDAILNLGEYRASQTAERDPALILESFRFNIGVHEGSSKLRHVTIDIPKCLDMALFDKWIFTFLWEKKLLGLDDEDDLGEETDIMRIKGILYSRNSQGVSSAFALQAVEQMYELTPLKDKTISRCCLIFIGMISNMDEIKIRLSFSKTFLNQQ